MEAGLEFKCPGCGFDRAAGQYYSYHEEFRGDVRSVTRRQTPKCLHCRADAMVNSNTMPAEFREAEEVGGAFDYTAKYRRYQNQLAADYDILSRNPVMQQAAHAAALRRRAMQVMANPDAVKLIRTAVASAPAGAPALFEWVIANGVCYDCRGVFPSSEFIKRVRRGRGFRYEFKERCSTCRKKYSEGVVKTTGSVEKAAIVVGGE